MTPQTSTTASQEQLQLISEATALRWRELHKNTKKALQELLQWLDAAVNRHREQSTAEQLSTSFLINGLRGYGKTTVLLTADFALDRAEDRSNQFFAGDLSEDGVKVKSQCDNLRQKLHWLKILDLELMDPKANLLAFLLAKMRTTIDEKFGTEDRLPPSILGGKAEKTWRKLDRLVSDASFMWEEVVATNRHERAEQQLTAADTFAKFNKEFREAIPLVIDALSLHGKDEQSVLVAPIDNVDRSIEHLWSIVKLVRMASSPRLWFVLAAGRPDFQLFLQRSFEHELLPFPHHSNGPRDARDQEDARQIARRQAATTMIRILPPSYQTTIEPVTPEDAGSFKDERYLAKKGLDSLLEQFSLPHIEVQDPAGRFQEGLLTVEGLKKQDGAFEQPKTTLLFNVKKRLVEEVRERYRSAVREVDGQFEDGEQFWTFAGQMALTCAPRTLRDFTIALDRSPAGDSKQTPATDPKQGGRKDKEEWERRWLQAEAIVRVLVQMLRNAIEESDLPSWASEVLSRQVIRPDTKNRWVLDLIHSPIQRVRQPRIFRKVDCSRRELDRRYAGRGDTSSAWSSELQLRQLGDFNFELYDQNGHSTPLPSDVLGWFVLYHDLLAMFPYTRVLSQTPIAHQLNPEFVVTRHLLPFESELVDFEFWWKLPQWTTFLDFDIFIAQWRAFLWAAGPVLESPIQKMGEQELVLRLVLAAWVDNVCSVGRNDTRGLWEWSEILKGLVKLDEQDKAGPRVRPQVFVDPSMFRNQLEKYEEEVRHKIGVLWWSTCTSRSSEGRPRVAREWLRETLPLLTLPEYSPHFPGTHRAKVPLHLLDRKELPQIQACGSYNGRFNHEGRGGWMDLKRRWLDDSEQREEQRRQVVRDAIMSSAAYRKKQETERMSQQGLRRWLARFMVQWFKTVGPEDAGT